MRAPHVSWILIPAVVASLACSSTDAVTSGTGSISLTVSTTGIDQDPDGYEVIVGDVRRSVSTGTTIMVDGLVAPRVHTVQLDGLTSNCTVNGQNPRSVAVSTGETVHTAFAVVCKAFTTDVTLTVTTTGTDADQDGYLVSLTHAATELRVPANAIIRIPEVPVGSYTLFVSDIDPNCQLIPSGPRTVFVIRHHDRVNVDIDIVCVGAAKLEVKTVTMGSHLDATGYIVAAHSGQAPATVSVAANGAATMARLAPRDHVVWLRGLAGNCVPDPTWQRVPMTSGETAVVTFEVECSTATPIAFVVTDGTESDIHITSSAGGGATRLVDHGPNDTDPAWSPDGSRIAFTSDRDAPPGIHIMTADGTGVTRLTDPGYASYSPAWSPDGTRIVFVSERDGNAELYVMNADGTNQTRLTNNPVRDTDPNWSPDGSTIVFSSDRDGNAEIYTLRLETGEVNRLTRTGTWAVHPTWSPDGTRIAFTRAVCIYDWDFSTLCYNEVVVTDVTGSGQDEVARGENPAWSPDGTRLAVTRLECDDHLQCFPAGIEIVASVSVLGYLDYPEIWGPPLTRGTHSSPAWKP